MVNRTKINFIVDSVAFAAFLFLTTSGVLIHYILPPGSGRRSLILGFDRHQWGNFHFWVAVVMLAALVVHILLHWRWIVCVIKGRKSESSGHRLVLGVVGLAALVALVSAPLFFPVETTHTADSQREKKLVRGSMTLQEVEEATGVSVEVIIRELNLPNNISRNIPIRELTAQHGFSMMDIRRVVDENAKPQD